MSAIIPPKRPGRMPLKLIVPPTSNSSSSSSSTASSDLLPIASTSTSTTTLTSATIRRPILKISSIASSLASLALVVPVPDKTTQQSGSVTTPPSQEEQPSSASTSTAEEDEDQEGGKHTWGNKNDQARMTGEIMEIIGRRPTPLPTLSGQSRSSLEDELSGRAARGPLLGLGRPIDGPIILDREALEGVLDVGVESSVEAPLDVSPEMLADLGKLGEGASGEVRKVRHTGTGIIMAKKVGSYLYPFEQDLLLTSYALNLISNASTQTISTSPNPKIHRQHLRELLFMRECKNPHIVQYYGAFLEDNDTQIGICMEYCEGGSLEVLYKKVKTNGWRTGEKVLGKIAESVLTGLVYLHSQKVIHRDIKPSNVLVTRSGQIKLCDFGVSGELINSLAGTFLGTIFYLSPERIKGDKYSINADVWSMTLTVLEVALNRYPFPAEGEAPLSSPFELLTYLVSMESPRLEDELDKGIRYTNAFRDFVKRGLDKNASTRPTPGRLLEHPWIRRSSQRSPPADLGGWVRDLVAS